MSLDPSTFADLLRADAVRSIGILRRCGWWEVWVRVGQTKAQSAAEPIHRTPGGMHQWATFEAAYDFVRDQGYRGTVEVDDAIESASDRANPDLAAAPDTTEPPAGAPSGRTHRLRAGNAPGQGREKRPLAADADHAAEEVHGRTPQDDHQEYSPAAQWSPSHHPAGDSTGAQRAARLIWCSPTRTLMVLKPLGA